jgi:hypothetical protein
MNRAESVNGFDKVLMYAKLVESGELHGILGANARALHATSLAKITPQNCGIVLTVVG